MRRTIFSGFAVLLMTTMAHGQEGGLANEAMKTKLDAIFAPMTGANSPGLAVLVRKDGRTIFEYGYGVRNLRTKEKIDAHTNFRLASFTKQFTAMAAMLLVRDGKLRYDETLTEVFPSFPAYGKTITIRNLLTHTSGLPDYEDTMEAVEKTRGTLWTPEKQIQDAEVLKLLEKETKGKFAPGTSWSYSNSGYVVLGLIVARVSGKPYGEFIRARIVAPLKMNDTIVFQKGKNKVANRAFGHSKEGDGFKETDQSATSATLGDGGIYSSVEDLAKWDEALQKHTLLSEEEMKPALTPVKLADGSETRWPAEPGEDNLHPGKPVSYGFGWLLDPYKGHARMWHWGSTTGFRTVIERFTNDQLTIIILCNRTDVDAEKLALQVAELIFKEQNSHP
jgi:CubicO group peptidase (beta-lactamase class C family)